jgi:thymidylate synthase
MSDVTLRKKKNADAQAAFRARRANYIAILEETVTNLESVVLELQTSCQENRNEVQELRDENSHLWHEFREREKFWSAVWQAGEKSQGPESNYPSASAPHEQHTRIGVDLYEAIGH